MWAFAPSSTSYTPTRARPPDEPVAESAPANPILPSDWQSRPEVSAAASGPRPPILVFRSSSWARTDHLRRARNSGGIDFE
jgi:hypothetical protein